MSVNAELYYYIINVIGHTPIYKYINNELPCNVSDGKTLIVTDTGTTKRSPTTGRLSRKTEAQLTRMVLCWRYAKEQRK